VDDLKSEALIKGECGGIFDRDMQMNAAAFPASQTAFQCLIEGCADRFSAILRQNFNRDKFPVTRRLSGAAPSLKRRQADNRAGVLRYQRDDRGVQQEK